MKDPRPCSSQSRWWLALLPCALAVYLLLATAQLDLPGPNYDETLDAVPAMQFVLGEPLDAYAVVRLLGREWPLTIMPYVGCTSTYLLMPVFALLGPSVMTLRLTMISLGALTLLLAWGVVRCLLGIRIAGLATLLLAISPAYVFWTRIGAYISLPLVPLALAVVWALHRWRSSGAGRYLVLAAFLTGLGLTTKILFVWLIVALAVAWLLLAPPSAHGRHRWVTSLPPTCSRTWWLAALAGLVGLAPFLAFNILYSGETLRLLQRNLVQTELYGVHNLDLWSNLRIVFGTDLRALLDGAWFADVLGGSERSWLTVPTFLASLVVLGLLARARRLAHPRRVAMLVVLLVAITAQSAITISSLGANHLAILWPWPQTLIAAAAVGLLDWAQEQRSRAWLPRALAALLVLAPLASDARTVAAYEGHMARTGGVGHWSDAIYTLAADLDRPDAPPAVALDWGFKRNMQLLTNNRVIPEDGFTYSQQPDESYRCWAEWRLAQGPALYIEHAAPYVAFGGHRERLEEAAYRTGRELVLWREYRQRDGQPIYRVYSVVAAVPLEGLPQEAVALAAQFGDEIALLGHDPFAATWRSGEEHLFNLYWQAEGPPAEDYQVFVHLAAPDEQIVAQHDGMPVLWAYPTSSWEAGEIVADRVVLRLPNEVAPGRYRLWLGLYRQADGVRLEARQDGSLLPDGRLLLGEIEIAP